MNMIVGCFSLIAKKLLFVGRITYIFIIQTLSGNREALIGKNI